MPKSNNYPLPEPQELTCSSCGGKFLSKNIMIKGCPLCKSAGWSWKPEDSLRYAPMTIINALATPFVTEYMSDTERRIINIRQIDYIISGKVPGWETMMRQKRMKSIIFLLHKMEPTLRREIHSDLSPSHIFYRTSTTDKQSVK